MHSSISDRELQETIFVFISLFSPNFNQKGMFSQEAKQRLNDVCCRKGLRAGRPEFSCPEPTSWWPQRRTVCSQLLSASDCTCRQPTKFSWLLLKQLEGQFPGPRRHSCEPIPARTP